MSSIVINYNPFDVESTATLIKDESQEQRYVSSDIETLVKELISLAYQYNAYDIKVHGPLAVESEIRNQISELEKDKYSENKITIEGI